MLGGRRNRANLFARSHGPRFIQSPRSRRRFDSSSVASSSSSSSFTGSEDAVRDVLYGLHIADGIYICARYMYYPRKGGLAEKRSAERSSGKLVAAALPLIYGNRRDSYGKVTAERSIKRRAACPRESATAGNES